MAIGMGIAFVLQAAVFLFWKKRANKKYYERQKMQGMVINTFEDWEKLKKSASVEFRKFPILFVFPSVFLIVFKFFATGLAKNSAALIVMQPSAGCNTDCKAAASISMTLVVAFVGLGWYVLTDFNVRFRNTQWKPAGAPASAEKVDDPFFRGLSLVRAWCFGKDDPRSILNRSQGKYGKPPNDVVEPARTVRNLSHPLTWRKHRAGDLLEAYQFAYFPLAGGTSSVAIYFNTLIMTIQLAMAILCGIGSTGILTGSFARAQVQVVFSCQFFIFAYIWCLFPAHDRADNLMFCLQFGLEGASTAMLYSSSGMIDELQAQASLKQAAFICSLTAVGVPLLRRFYDGVIVQCIKLRRKGPFNAKAAALAFLLFLLQLQATILKLLGISSGEAKSTAGAVATMAKLANREAAAGFSKALEMGITLGADLWGMLYSAPSTKLDGSAVMIQKHARRKGAAKKAKELLGSIRVIQRFFRAMRQAKKNRQELEAFLRLQRKDWVGAKHALASTRPGFTWLLHEETVDRAKEVIQRIRRSQRGMDKRANTFSRSSEGANRIKANQLSNEWGCQVMAFQPTAKRLRLPPPKGLPPQLLAPPLPKPISRTALSAAAFDDLEKVERTSVIIPETVKQEKDSAHGRYGHHDKVGLVFTESLRSQPRRLMSRASFHRRSQRDGAPVTIQHHQILVPEPSAPCVVPFKLDAVSSVEESKATKSLTRRAVELLHSFVIAAIGYGLVGSRTFVTPAAPANVAARRSLKRSGTHLKMSEMSQRMSDMRRWRRDKAQGKKQSQKKDDDDGGDDGDGGDGGD